MLTCKPKRRNAGFCKNVTVAVLDTGINSMHNDLAVRVVQNVKLPIYKACRSDYKSIRLKIFPIQTDQRNGTFVAGVIAASGISSAGNTAESHRARNSRFERGRSESIARSFRFRLCLGTVRLKRPRHHCSFSANTVFDITIR